MSRPPAASGASRPANRLARETSAYLRQHMHNPVDWHPWGEEAIALAKREDRPLLVSIGYSACHWCHVMERESFEDEETAGIMNRLFVPVKVDREERPDVDQIYMDAVVRLTGHGGWPLTAFCLPDGRPFHLGTYFPPEPGYGRPSFRQVMAAVDEAWRTRRADVERAAESLTSALGERATGVASEPIGVRTLAGAARELLTRADTENGGLGDAPKFPTPTSLDLLLAGADVLEGDEGRACATFVAFTAREMSRRGLYDHLGGGFHRYCVDATWTIPHFEKMLYDQGQLLRTYAEALRRTGDDELRWPVLETAEYLRREMRGAEGGLHASQDADSEGVEGKFFVWRPEEIAAVLGAERARAFCDAYSVSSGGNFEHGTSQLVDVARAPRERFAEERRELFAARARRVAPATDTKRVAAWNALAVSGLARASSVLGEPALLDDAIGVADFVLRRMRDGHGRLHRVFAEGRAHGPAFLDDVACLLEACLDLHRAGAGDRFLVEARGLAHDVTERFYDPDERDLFLVPNDGERLAVRPRSDHDGATPHSTGLAVLELLRFAALSGDVVARRVAEAVLRTHAFAVERVPAAFPTLLRAAALAERGPAVAVVIGGDDAPATGALAAAARRRLAPEDAVLVHAPGAAVPEALDPSWLDARTLAAGRPALYLCRGHTCSLPITEPDGIEPLLAPAGDRSLR